MRRHRTRRALQQAPDLHAFHHNAVKGLTVTRHLMMAAVALTTVGLAADARAADQPTHTIVPSVTDPAIIDTASPVPGTRGNHLVWLSPEKASQVNKLLVFLPSG